MRAPDQLCRMWPAEKLALSSGRAIRKTEEHLEPVQLILGRRHGKDFHLGSQIWPQDGRSCLKLIAWRRCRRRIDNVRYFPFNASNLILAQFLALRGSPAARRSQYLVQAGLSRQV